MGEGGSGEDRIMAKDSPVLEALARLDQALTALDDAVERREDEGRRRVDLEAELHRVGADRSRLAQALDAAAAKASRLEDANREVSRRLVAAMESIRSTIAGNEGRSE
jgi:chromosome segregation ATPase